MSLNFPKAPEWTVRAKCRDENPELFFGDERSMASTAKKVCSGCPVSVQCLTLALDAEGGIAGQSRFGIYGGLSPDERADLGRRRSA